MAKTGLGRGLGALMSGQKPSQKPTGPDTKVESSSAMDPLQAGSVLNVEITKIRPCPSQPRKVFNNSSLEELAESIKANGVIQPLVVRPSDHGQFELIAGERRWRAAQIAGLNKVPVIIRLANDAQVLEMALVENLQREDLNPIEEAQGYALLIEAFNLTQEETAQRVGKSRAAVANILRLLNLPEKAITHVRDGRLSMGHAKAILAIEDAGHQNLVAEKVIRESLNVRQTEGLVAELQKNSTGSPEKNSKQSQVQGIHVTDLVNRLKERLGTKVGLTYREGKGTLTIKYFSDEDLDRILNILDVDV